MQTQTHRDTCTETKTNNHRQTWQANWHLLSSAILTHRKIPTHRQRETDKDTDGRTHRQAHTQTDTCTHTCRLTQTLRRDEIQSQRPIFTQNTHSIHTQMDCHTHTDTQTDRISHTHWLQYYFSLDSSWPMSSNVLTRKLSLIDDQGPTDCILTFNLDFWSLPRPLTLSFDPRKATVTTLTHAKG